MTLPPPALEVFADLDALAAAAARLVVDRVLRGCEAHRRFSVALSGGRTPWAALAALPREGVPWDRVDVYQVDERVVPADDPARTLPHLEAALPPGPALHPMPVAAPDLAAAAAGYAARLPRRLGLVHLGLGADGHTASLVPGDPVLDVEDVDVAVTQPYAGHRRMTLTYPALDRASEVLWLVAGADKAPALRRLLAGDSSIPAGRVRAARQVVLADAGAAGDLAPRGELSGA